VRAGEEEQTEQGDEGDDRRRDQVLGRGSAGGIHVREEHSGA
jgi:hypothetical protein